MTYWFDAGTAAFDLASIVKASSTPARLADSIETLVATLAAEAQPGDDIVIMSNGGFAGIHQKLLQALRASAS